MAGTTLWLQARARRRRLCLSLDVRLLGHAMSYYILQNDETKGPYTIGQLRSMWNSGAITGQTHYCQEGYSEWLPLRGLQAELEPPPPPPSPPAYVYSPPAQLPATQKVQTIEATSKSWKAAQFLSSLAIIAGFFFIAFAIRPLGIFMVIGGLIGCCIAMIGAWWENG